MNTLRRTYLETASVVPEFLGSAAVEAAWDKPSALKEFAICGLGGHLALQVTRVPRLLAAGPPPPGTEVLDAVEHYVRSRWIGVGVTDDSNVSIRRESEQEAAEGQAELVRRTTEALDRLRAFLPAESPDRMVHLPGGPWSLTLDDYLTTRLVEMVVHCDDLAASLDIEPPELPPAAVDTVLVLLTRVAARRHGPFEVLRALTRAERAPDSITAI
jgi:hypothetical protein